MRIDLQGVRQDRQWSWGGLVYGAGLGWFKVDGTETPATTIQTAYQYRINAVPLDVTAGVRVDLNQRWWLEARGIVGAGPTLLAIDSPSSGAGNLQAASGSTAGLYTEYGAALNVVRRCGQWEAGLEGRWLQGRHSAAFERREFINGALVSSDPYEVRLNQTGFAVSFMLGRWF